MTNETQKEFVKDVLLSKGYITRNECLRNYISRLGAIIHTLKSEGWDFKGEYVKTKNGNIYCMLKLFINNDFNVLLCAH